MNPLADPIFGHAATRARFSDEARAGAMARGEIALAKAQSSLGIVPDGAATEIAGLKAPENVSDVLADGVAASGGPVPALIDHWRRDLSTEAADWLHCDATSQDTVDIAFALCADAALKDHAAKLANLTDSFNAISERQADTFMPAPLAGSWLAL